MVRTNNQAGHNDRHIAMAAAIANNWECEIEDWMVWEGWETWVGCERCNEEGPMAGCWGVPDCHGYEWGCGCMYCAEQEKLESELGRRTP